ncbi:MAG: HAD family hydrolase [Spirochaetes bacterium]|nr:HAD family hydrolase [Spirochaetota bacterium]MBU0956447.1 HAD family hydrolase [Spirochaetota bacterium]
MIKAIGFDIDGTLYPASALFGRMLPGALYRLPLLLAFNKVRKNIRIPAYYQEQGLEVPADQAAFHVLQNRLTAEILKTDPERTGKRIEAFFYQQQEALFDRVPLFPLVHQTLSALRELGLPLGALSDFPARGKLQRMGLSGYFDVIMTSEDCGYVKPHRASFDRLARELGAANEQVLYVGNSEHYDVAGARAAGMQTALISSRPTAGSQADLVFKGYDELLAWVKEQLS